MPNLSMGAFPRRSDLVDEIDTVFNVNGNYVSGWYDSSGLNSVRVAAYNMTGTGLSFQIQEAQISQNSTDGSLQPVRIQKLTVDTTGSVWAEVKLTGRFFAIVVTSGEAASPLRITVRGV